MNEGDVVVRVGSDCCSARAGVEYTVLRKADGQLAIGTDSSDYCHCQSEWTLIRKKGTYNSNNMSLISRFKNITRTEPEKTFVKAGIMNESLELTTEGRDLFLSYLLDKNKNDFKKDVVDAIVKEMEDEKE